MHPSRGNRTPTAPGPVLRHRETTSPPLRTEADGPRVRPRCSGTALRCRTTHARAPGFFPGASDLWPLAVGLWSLASRLWPPPCTRQNSGPQPSDPRLQPDRSATAIPIARGPGKSCASRGGCLWPRYNSAVPLRRCGGAGTPAMQPAVDHPEADQNKHRPTDGPTHGGTVAIVADTHGEEENGQGHPCPVEGPVQSVGYRRPAHSLILADAYDLHQMRTRRGDKGSCRNC